MNFRVGFYHFLSFHTLTKEFKTARLDLYIKRLGREEYARGMPTESPEAGKGRREACRIWSWSRVAELRKL